MIVRFGLELDRLLPTKPQTSLGHVTAGPGTFLSILETRLGLPSPSAPPATRLVQYRACLLKCDSPKRFYHESFHVDDLGVARTLLDWRDEWYMAGWGGTFSKKAGKRLKDMTEVESLANKEVSPSFGQRLQAVLQELKDRKTQIEKIELVDTLSDLPHLWQKVLSYFEVVELNIDDRSLCAEKNSDLIKLQKALLDLNQQSGVEPKSVKLKGDGSVVVLIARSKEVSARLLAEHIRSYRQNSNLAVLTGKNGILFDEALECVDEARCGLEKASKWRPVLQVLPLALNLLWEPLDPHLLLQFLNHPVGPLPIRFRRKLAAAVIDSPGIGGRSWQKAQHEIMEHERKEREADEEQIKHIQEEIDFWVTCPRFDPDQGVPVDVITERCEAVARWLGKMRWVEQDSPEHQLYIQAFGQAQDFFQALEQLTAQGVEFIHQSQLNRLLDEITGSGAPMADKYSECGHIPAADSPAAFAGDFDEIFWCDFSMPALPKTYPWTRSERSALSSHGVQLQALDDKLEYEAKTWLRPVLSAKKRIIFVLHHTDEEHHPLWDQITTYANGWLEMDAEEMVQAGGKLPELDVKSTAMDYQPLPTFKRWWKIKDGRLLGKRDSESYTSLDTFVKSPYQWVLRYKAQLEEGSLAALPSGNLLKGSLVHRLIEDFFTENTNWEKLNDKQMGQWLKANIPVLLEQEGAVLLGPGQTMEREAFTRTANRAFLALVDALKRARVKSVAIESHQSGKFLGGKLTGYIDMLLTDAGGREIVLDVKWGGYKYRMTDLKKNMHLQLAVYAHLRKQLTKLPLWPPQAYFVIEDAQILAQDDGAFQAAVLYPAENGETTKDLWRRFEATWKWRREQLDQGLIEVTVEGTEPGGNSEPPENGLVFEDYYNHFNDYPVLTGWGEDA
jgi:ATP-dependent helicase/nuclease subunit B